MITLTTIDLKTKKRKIECFSSKDKAEARISKLITDTKMKDGNKGHYLDSWSFDTKSEEDLIKAYLPEDRITKR